ncbi:MAG: tripartite tricarboxylate transporter substrate-binding protein, partial [Betaproteobacteria bacterium]
GFAPALPHIRAGRLNALAVTGEQRLVLLPDVPTMQELGLNMVTLQWAGLALPTGNPTRDRRSPAPGHIARIAA